MRKLWVLLLASVLLGWLGACCSPGTLGQQPVTLHPQQTSEWCWAASGEMVMDFLGHDVAQCVEANNEFGRSDCCTSPVPNLCVNGGWPEPQKYHFTAATTADAPLTWVQIKDQVACRKEPFAFSWHWLGGGGHMMVVTGYAEAIAGTNWVTINDPWPPPSTTSPGGGQRPITYDEYVSGSDHTHWNDYYNWTYTP